MKGSGAYAELIAKRFRLACKKHGLNGLGAADRGLDTSLFRPPARESRQLSLF
jgi:hypothetical protein